jgi:hypothetical protein
MSQKLIIEKGTAFTIDPSKKYLLVLPDTFEDVSVLSKELKRLFKNTIVLAIFTKDPEQIRIIEAPEEE